MISEELKIYFEKADSFKMLETHQQYIVQYSMNDEKEKDRLFVKNHMFLFVLEGNQGVATPNFFYKLETGEAIFVKKGSIIVCEKLRKASKLKCLLVFLTDDFLSTFISRNRQLIVPSELLDLDSLGAYQFYLDQCMSSYVNSVLSYFELSFPPVSELIKHKLQELLMLLITGQERSYFMSLLRECIIDDNSSIDTVVNTNLYKSLNVDHLAYLANLSLSQFKREFRKKYNDSPARWLRKKRLEKSSKLLLTTNKSINEICYDSGFNNTSHFCQLFQKQYQTSPLKYRKQMST